MPDTPYPGQCDNPAPHGPHQRSEEEACPGVPTMPDTLTEIRQEYANRSTRAEPWSDELVGALLAHIDALTAAYRATLDAFERACEFIAEHPEQDDNLTDYMAEIEKARTALEPHDD